MPNKSDRDELMEAGRRAAYKNQCQSVIVAPDHTGEDNYHNCSAGSPGHSGHHYCGCSYDWNDAGEVVNKPTF